MVASAVLLLILSASSQPQEYSPDAVLIESSAASCVGSQASYPNAPAVYQIVPDANVPSGIAATAASAWNNASCNPGGTSFPRFTTSPEPGAVPVPLHFNASALNDRNNFSCGQFNALTGEITIFAHAKLPNGTIGSCGASNIEAQSLEHELGHRLGLIDQYATNCQGFIMSQVAYPPATGSIPPQPLPRSIQPGECGEANTLNKTPTERAATPPPPPAPTQCPPVCSCPSACPTTCDDAGNCPPSGNDPCLITPGLPECNGGGGGFGGCGTDDDPCDDLMPRKPPLPPTAHRFFCRT